MNIQWDLYRIEDPQKTLIAALLMGGATLVLVVCSHLAIKKPILHVYRDLWSKRRWMSVGICVIALFLNVDGLRRASGPIDDLIVFPFISFILVWTILMGFVYSDLRKENEENP